MKSKRLLLLLLMAMFAPWAAQAQTRDVATVNFETGDLTALSDIGAVTNDATYPWAVTNAANHTDGGTYCIKSSIENQHGKTSSFQMEVAFNEAGSISFYAMISSESGYDKGYFSIDGTNQINGISGSGSWTSYSYEVTAGTHTFRWYYTKDSSASGGDDRFYVDDITFDGYYVPSCPKPTSLAVSGLTHNEATLSWTENGTATSWQYCLNGDEENPVTISTNPYTLTGLTPLTAYTVKVRSVGNNEYSDWSSELSFSTTAVAEAVGDGWSDDFEGATCGWDLVNGTLTNAWAWGTAANNGGTHGLYVSNDNGITNAYTNNSSAMVFATKLLNFTEGKFEFSYDWICNGESNYDYLRVALVPASVTLTAGTTPSGFGTTSLPTGWIALDGGSKLNGVTAWQNKSVAINVPAGNYYLVMAWKDDTSGGTNPPAAVDNVSITKIACDYDVEGLAVSNITTTTADIAWTDSEAGEWQVALKEGTDEWETLPTTFTTNGGTLTGLTAATNYQVKVRAYCDAEHQGPWCDAISFASACDPTPAVGFTEDFDDITLPSTYTPSSRTLPTCWSYINECTHSSYMYYPTMYYYSYTNYANSTPNSLRLCSGYNSYTDYDPQPQYAILPEMDNLAGLQVTLMARGAYASSTFKIGTMSDPTDATTFSMIAEQELTTSYPEEAFAYIIPATCTDSYLAIMIDAADISRTTNGVYIDDIVIREAPTCFKPTELAVTANSITSDGAIITWTAGGDETQWQIEFATNANFTNPLYETVQGEPTYTFHGLDESTTYYVHVQAVCGGSDGSSEYSSVVSFTTLQLPANLPYATDFESGNDWLLVNGNLTNAWAYGTATSNGEGTHALYISNDGGTTNAYTANSEAMVYATKLFNFEAGTYVFSFDWKANGESTYDYLRVALVPSTVQLAAATSVPSGFSISTLPTGWIALDGGSKLNLKSDWQTFASDEIEVAAGTYMMVFAWRDDTSTGNNPPAAIDNVSIEIITCTMPANLAVPAAGITATSVQVSWTETGEATAWQIELTENNNGSSTIDVAETDLVDGVYTIASLTPETMYSVKVRANCGDGYSSWSEEIIFETAALCQMADGLAATDITSRSAVISWNGYGQDYFNLRYGTDGETWTTESKVANPYTLNQLEPATTYYVQVQPTCAGEEVWSAEYSFTTECEVITIAENSTYTYDFESETPWTCWTNVAGSNVRSTGTNNTTGGNYKLLFKGTTTGNIVAMPAFTPDINGLMLTFWTRPESSSYSSCGTFSVGYMTNLDDATTFVPVATYNRSDWTLDTYKEKKAVFTNAPAGAYIAFCHNALATNYYWYVDDVTVEIAPSYTLIINGYNNDENEGGYYLIASPVTVDLTNHAMTTGEFDLYAFDQAEDDEWQNYETSAFNLVPGKGYLYAHKTGGEFTLTGVPYSGNGEVTLQKTDGALFAGWNLVGNPFAEEAYITEPYYTLNTEGSEVMSETSTAAIAPMEGVFVIAEEDGEILTFTTNSRATSASLALNLSQGRGTIDRAIVNFGEGSLPKFQLNPNHTKVYIPVDGKDYAVVSANEMGEMPVNFKAEKNGTYSLSFTSQEVSFCYLHLIDNMTGNDVNLLETPSYTFNATTTDYANRFRLVFATGSSVDGDSFSFINNSGNLCIFGIEGEATVQVVDVMGHVLSSETFSGSYEKSINAAPGVYMIRLINGDDVKVQKIVVR